jgi:hypothetical protein
VGAHGGGEEANPVNSYALLAARAEKRGASMDGHTSDGHSLSMVHEVQRVDDHVVTPCHAPRRDSSDAVRKGRGAAYRVRVGG